MTRWVVSMTCGVFLTGVGLGGAAFSVQGADTGAITGTIEQPKQVTAITAISRDNDKKYPGKLDPQTGRFTIEGLPLGAVYDCQLDMDSARLEGVNLNVKRSEYEEEQPLSKDDIEAIKTTTLGLNKFEDKVDVLAVRGNIQHAAVLINKVRTKPFINSLPGEMVWRLELWHFEKPDETWIKEQDELFIVLYRERLQKTVYDKKVLVLDPSLGGLQVTREVPTVDVGTINLPKKEPGIRLRAKREGSGTKKGG